MKIERSYEVETRLYFNSDEEALTAFPFLKDTLKKDVKWVTKTFGKALFKEDKLLRASYVNIKGKERVYLGYKEPDLGNLCNIRLELDEDITDCIDSDILKLLNSKETIVSPESLNTLLDSLGHEEFMSFNGYNSSGYNKDLGIAFKLLHCDILEYPILLELEKTANSLEETAVKEKELLELIESYNLTDRIVRKEPPTLLYEKVVNL
jgi:adenylate cyclase class IV